MVYLSQALATARASQPRRPESSSGGRTKKKVRRHQPRGTAHAKKARAQVKIRSARKSADQQVRTADSRVAKTRGRTKRLLDQQPSLALNAKRRLIDQTIALETVTTKRDGLQAIEKLGKVAAAQTEPPPSV